VASRWWNGRAVDAASAEDLKADDRVDPIALAAALALAVLYAPLVLRLAHLWSTDPYAGHGMFVPAYSALLLWFDRQRLAATPRRVVPAGAMVVLASIAFLWIGQRGDSVILQGLSLVAAVGGAVLWRFGPERLRAAAFPIAFLTFMLPLPRAVVDMVTLEAQTFHARFTSVLLEAMGIPHLQQGIHINLPNATLVVVEGCNGLRFLMALVTLTAAFAQASQRTLRRKILLVALAVPIAVIANGFRVTALSLAAYHLGAHAAAGMTHHTIGKTLWAVTLGVMLVIGMLLRRAGPRPAAPAPIG
jgi:exosortase